MDKIINKKNNLLNKLSRFHNKHIRQDDIDELFNFIEGGYCKYSELIQDTFNPKDMTCSCNKKFGKFFKNNGGIKPNINKIYELFSNNDLHGKKYFAIIDFIINNELFYSAIFVNVNNGCETCHMGYEKECKMYINNNLRDLIYNSVGNELDEFL